MSRYHPVRPKQNKHPKVPQPAVPAQPGAAAEKPPMPTQAQMEKVARERLSEAARAVYLDRGGEILDKSIERWKRTLDIYDRECAKFAEGEVAGGYRWSISPTAAMRAQTMLERAVEQRENLLRECWAEARNIMARFAQQQMEAAQQQVDESLCQAKDAETAPEADSGLDVAEVFDENGRVGTAPVFDSPGQAA
jgi:hypothetical protein